ncbi:MAG: alkaline phosphatase family protein, partial [Propionibacteriaceae bacterium]|nr:alkaline phosphatase family protein [Propionibacteriaceae bacterium]
GIEGSEYAEAIRRVDAHVGALVAEVRQRADNGEQWLVAAVTDHGHIPEGGHGGDSPAERASFVIAAGFGRSGVAWPESIAPHELVDLILTERTG